MVGKITMLVENAMNNNAVVNTFLVVAFGMLTLRSESSQKQIEALEAEKHSLLDSNKAAKAKMWDWRQQLFAEAATTGDSAVVPLSRLKAIYGDVTTATSGDKEKEDLNSPAPKITI